MARKIKPMSNLLFYCLIGGAAGGLVQYVIHLFFDLPFPVEGCIAGSVGYMSAWCVELHLNRRPKFKMERWGR